MFFWLYEREGFTGIQSTRHYIRDLSDVFPDVTRTSGISSGLDPSKTLSFM